MEASKLIGYDGRFASRLRDLMKNAKVTQQDLAASVGTTRQAISQYADGSVQPNIEKLYKIAEFFKVSADYLLGMSDVTSINIETKEISRITGLTEHSINRLQHDVNWTCELGHSDIAEQALKNIITTDDSSPLVPATIYTPTFHVINLLLCDKPINLNYEPIICVLGKILSFNNQLNNETYGLFKHTPKNEEFLNSEKFASPHPLTDEELEKMIEDENSYDFENGPHYFLNRDNILNLLLVELQSTIKRYKDEHEKDN